MLRVFRTRSSLTFFLVALVALGIVLRTAGRLGPVEDAANTILEPVQNVLLSFANGVSNLFGGFQDVNTLRAQVKELEAQLNKLTVDAVRVRELETENSQLREQLAYKQANPDFALIGGTILERNANPDLARVISQDPSNLVKYVTVDQGRVEGVSVGMPAATPAGLVGRISEVGAHWSRILLITDPSSAVNAVIQSSRATGVVQGLLGDSRDYLVMKYLPQGESVKVNDLVLTSGIGGRFPKRLVIGQVVQVNKRDTDLFQETFIKPSVDFNRLEFLLIVKNFTPTDITQEATPTPSPAASPSVTPAKSATPTKKP